MSPEAAEAAAAGTEPVAVETEAPAVVEAPEAPVEEQQVPLSRREAKARMSADRAQREAKQKVVDELAALPAEGDESTASAEATPEEVAAPAETPPEGEVETKEPGTEPAAEGEVEPISAITVELDPRHPATQGLEGITVATEQEARFVRTLMNGYVRRGEVDEAVAENQQLTQELMAERAARFRRETTDQVHGDWQGTEEYKAARVEYDRINEEIGPEAAVKYWDGVTGQLRQVEEQQYNEKVAALQQQEDLRHGDLWANRMWERVGNMAEYITSQPNLPQLFNNAAHSFNRDMSDGLLSHVNRENVDDQFIRFFQKSLIGNDAVDAAYKRFQEAKKIPPSVKSTEELAREAEAMKRQHIDEYKRELAAKRIENPPHPLGNLGGVPRDTESQGTSGAESDSADLSAHQNRRKQKMGARQDAQRRFRSE